MSFSQAVPRFAICLLVSTNALLAATVNLTPIDDTFISVWFAGPNGAGPDMVIGTQGSMAGFSPNRGLMKFDLSSIPAGAQITSVTLQITVTRSPVGPSSTKNLHRVLREWTEAASTWQLRTAGEQWGEPGGEAGTDYADGVSGNAVVGTLIQSYTFASTAGMIADVTHWINNPAQNYGWLVKTANEATALTARRVGSTDGSFRPTLTVNYTAPPPRPAISSVSLNGGQVCVGFQAMAGTSYVLERRAAVNTGGWTQVATLPPPGADGPATLCDARGLANAFYRIGGL